MRDVSAQMMARNDSKAAELGAHDGRLKPTP